VKKAGTYSSTSTIFYPTTRIATSFTLFRVMAGIATLAAIQVNRESGSTPFTAATAVNISMMPTVSEDATVNSILRLVDTRHF